jgi:hypothetical protein
VPAERIVRKSGRVEKGLVRVHWAGLFETALQGLAKLLDAAHRNRVDVAAKICWTVSLLRSWTGVPRTGWCRAIR